MANHPQHFHSLRCMYASRGCKSEVKYEALLSHHEECGFAPLQCSHDGCEEIINRQDLKSHQQSCEHQWITCEDCHEVMQKQGEYGKHACVFRKELNEHKRGLVEMQKILRGIQSEQRRQGDEIQRMARELRQLYATERQQSDNYHDTTERQQGENLAKQQNDSLRGITSQARRLNVAQNQTEQYDSARCHSRSNGATLLNVTQRQERDDQEATTASQRLFATLNPHLSQDTVDKQIVVAGGGFCDKSYEVFDWSSHKWTFHKDSLFFNHNEGFSFVYDNKIMICGGTDTNRVECVDIVNNRPVSTYPVLLPGQGCGKGVLCGDKILTFGQSVSATSLKPPFQSTVQSAYNEGTKLSSYGVARVNENAVVLVGGRAKNGKETNNVLLYNPTTKSFKKLAPLPYELEDTAVVVYKDNVVILGGSNGYRALTGAVNILSDVLMYNTRSQQCYKLPSMLEKRSKCAAVIMGDTIVAIGGNARLCFSPEEKPPDLKTAEYLVLGENKWTKLPPMQYGRAGATACVQP